MYGVETVPCDHAENLEAEAKPRRRFIETSTPDQIRRMGAVTDVNGVANVLGCSVQYARRLCASGTLQAVKMGTHWRVRTISLLRFAGLA